MLPMLVTPDVGNAQSTCVTEQFYIQVDTLKMAPKYKVLSPKAMTNS